MCRCFVFSVKVYVCGANRFTKPATTTTNKSSKNNKPVHVRIASIVRSQPGSSTKILRLRITGKVVQMERILYDSTNFLRVFRSASNMLGQWSERELLMESPIHLSLYATSCTVQVALEREVRDSVLVRANMFDGISPTLQKGERWPVHSTKMRNVT